MQNFLNSVQMQKPKRNRFDLTHDFKFSCNMGELVPVMISEAIPGDHFTINPQAMIRFQPTVAPPMHRFDIYIHYFFVPWRILWAQFEQWVVQEEVGGTVPAFPTITIANNGSDYTRLVDFMGIPDPTMNPGAAVAETISAFPFAAYQRICNEYYRDQNLSAEVVSELVNGSNNVNKAALTQMRRRAWEHDYFTACLPFAQKGDAVNVPVGNVVLEDPITGQAPIFRDGSGSPMPLADIGSDGSGFMVDGNTASFAWYDPNDTLEVEAGTIDDLRRAYALQSWLEKNARGGTRYTEHIKAHYGVFSSDKRLQRPEYITGIKQPITISEVLNTTGTVDAPQGTMAGHGIGVVNGKSGYFFCEEHGYIMGIMSVLPKTAYQQGIPRHFLKRESTELFYPNFAHIGEQEVPVRELYAYTANGGNPFGYLPRYAEYRTEPSRVAGDMRNDLNFWHAGRIFQAEPTLSDQFVEMNNEEVDRIFAVSDPAEDKLLCHVLNHVTAIRPIPKFGTPTTF